MTIGPSVSHFESALAGQTGEMVFMIGRRRALLIDTIDELIEGRCTWSMRFARLWKHIQCPCSWIYSRSSIGTRDYNTVFDISVISTHFHSLQSENYLIYNTFFVKSVKWVNFWSTKKCLFSIIFLHFRSIFCLDVDFIFYFSFSCLNTQKCVIFTLFRKLMDVDGCRFYSKSGIVIFSIKLMFNKWWS